MGHVSAMKRPVFVFSLCVLTFYCALSLADRFALFDGPSTRHILFVGNSFTAENDMPAMVEEKARRNGFNVRVTMVATGGYTLQKHSEDAKLLATLNRRMWDVVILQEQSQHFTFPREYVAKNSFIYGARLVDLIKAHSPDAKIYWYQTWGYRAGDPDNCPHFAELCTREGMERRISENIGEMAQMTDAQIVNGAAAWAQFESVHPTVNLYADDGKHPSQAGSRVIADAFYEALFQRP